MKQSTYALAVGAALLLGLGTTSAAESRDRGPSGVHPGGFPAGGLRGFPPGGIIHPGGGSSIPHSGGGIPHGNWSSGHHDGGHPGGDGHGPKPHVRSYGIPYFYYDYFDYAYPYYEPNYDYECAWLYRKAKATRSHYWWRRFYECVED